MRGICKKPKNSKTNNSQAAKSSDFVGYEGNAVSRVFIATVGSLSGRWIDDVRTLAASKRSRLVARVRTI
jgi:hypothetical protein